jgi:integrase
MAHIEKRAVKSGDRYDVRFTVNGRYRRQTFEKKKDADAFVTTLKAERQAGKVIDLRRGERLFGSYADEYIEHRLVKGKPLSPATKQGYRALMRRHLLPAFGQTRLNQINKDRVRQWHNKLAAKQPDQAAKAYRLLRAILMTAADDDLIPENPCRIKGAGAENAAERPMLDTTTVLQLADAMGPRLRAMVLIAGFRTLRTGEVLGLQRRDIDLLHDTIRVERQSQEVIGGRIVRENTKSEAGKRTLTLAPFLADALDEHLRLYVGPEPEAWLFTRSTGRPLRRQDLSHAWHDACTAVGLTPWGRDAPTGVRFYDLRHHAGTISARDKNTTTKELMAMMGHSSMRAAINYQHATEERDRDHAVTYLEGVFQNAASGTSKSAPVRIRS